MPNHSLPDQTKRNRILDLRLKGLTFSEIAKSVGLSIKRVTQLYRSEVLKRDGGPRYDTLRNPQPRKPKPRAPRKPRFNPDPWLSD